MFSSTIKKTGKKVSVLFNYKQFSPTKNYQNFDPLLWPQFSSDFQNFGIKQNPKASRRQQKKNYADISVDRRVIQE